MGVQLDAVPTNSSLYVCEDFLHGRPHGIFYEDNPIHSTYPLLMFELVLVVSITNIIRYLLEPFKQARIVSNVLGGLMIGPSVLGRNKVFSLHVYKQKAVYLLKHIATIGYILYLFVYGVKMDIAEARKAGKRQVSLAAAAFIIPFVVGFLTCSLVYKSLNTDLARPEVIGAIISGFVITAFPSIEQTIQELDLYSTEVGRLALSTTIVTDVVYIVFVITFEIIRNYRVQPFNSTYTTVSLLLIFGILIGGKYVMKWIAETTPEGKPVAEIYVTMIILGALLMSFLTDVTGINLGLGAHLLGLMVPTGPPLGTIIIQRMETVLNEFFMPFGFVFIGMATNLSSISKNWNNVWPLILMIMSVSMSKFLAVFGVSKLLKSPTKECLALSFIMSMRGTAEFILYVHWLAIKLINSSYFSLVTVLSILISVICMPMVTFLYDPSRPYMVNRRRALQYTTPDTELGIVACIYDQESVSSLINLLELSNPTTSSPLIIFSLHLIELAGRGHPMFVDHENQETSFDLTSYNRIHNALTDYQESVGEYVTCNHFTSVSPIRTMYQDVCKLALTKKATIIILPFRTESSDEQTELVHHTMPHWVNTSVLSHAPCSVGILVDRAGPFQNHRVNRTKSKAGHRYAVLFLGGADAREALSFADRATCNPNVSISVIRFLSHGGFGDDPMEKKLDDGVVTRFWVKNEQNERVTYKEAVVSDGRETVLGIEALMSYTFFDLWIVGRKNGINPVLIQGLSGWSRNNELGVIGDYIATGELGMNASLLVIQQQVLRG